jgi:hypothetical protein
MATKLELMLEAEKRGVLPPEKAALLNEARKRGLVGSNQEQNKEGNFLGRIGAAVAAANPTNIMGISDELGGLMAAAGGDSYEQGKKRIEETEKRLKEKYPKSSLAGEIAGTIPLALATPAATIPQMIASSAILGGAKGFAEAEGGYSDRLASGAVSATGSALASGAIGGAMKYVPKVYGAAKGYITEKAEDPAVVASKRAAQKVLSALDADKITPDMIQNYLGKGKSIVDIAGKRLAGLGETAALYGEGARDITEKFFETKQGGAAMRLKDSIAKFISKDFDYEDLAEGITQAGRKAADPLYKKAYAKSLKTTPEIDRILQTPSGKAAYNNALNLAQNEGKNIEKLGFETLDYVKRGFDIEINKYKNSIGQLDLDDMGRSIVGLRKLLAEEMKSANPIYKRAVETSGDYLSNVEAINRGRNFENFTTRQLSKYYKSLTEPEKRSFKAGVSSVLRDKIKTATTKDLSKRVIKNEETSNLLNSFLTQKEFKYLTKSVLDEEKFYKLEKKILGGSQTAGRQSSKQSFEQDSQLEEAFTRGGIRGLGFTFIVNKVKAASTGMNEKTAENVAKILYETNPTKQKEILKSLYQSAKNGDKQAKVGLEVYAGFNDFVKENIAKTVKNYTAVTAPALVVGEQVGSE